MRKTFAFVSLAHVWVYLFYLGVAVLITWPLVTVISTRLLGHPFGDSYEYIRHIWWIKHALQTGQPLFDQPLLAYPDGLTGAWLWGNPLQSFPAWLFAFILPLPAAFNLPMLLTLALNGWAMYWLMWHLTDKQRIPAIIAGLIFLAAPTFQAQLGAGHTGLLVLWPVPLYIHALVGLTCPTGARSLWLKIILAAGFFAVSLWGNQLLLIFMVAPVTILMMLMRFTARDWSGLFRIILAAGLGGLLSLFFLAPVAVEQLNTPAWLREGESVRYSADLLSIVTPSFYHPLFSKLDYTHQVLGIEPFERVGYVGIMTTLLIILAVWKMRAARWWLVAALIAWVFSLGPLLKVLDRVVTLNLGEYQTYITLPWAALGNLPLLNLTRTPARFNMTIALAAAIMAGYGAAILWKWMRLHVKMRGMAAVSAALLAAGILFEYQFFWPLPTIPGVPPDAVQALSQRGNVRAVFDIPWSHLLADKDGLFLQTGHQHPMIAGHVTRRSPVNPARLAILQGTLNDALLDAAGVDIVILHKQWDESNGATDVFTRSRLGQPFYEDDTIALFEVPAPSDEPEFMTLTEVIQALPLKEHRDDYFYTSESGWLHLEAEFEAAGRDLSLYLDGERLHGWHINGEQSINLALPVYEPGYHTITWAVEPPCGVNTSLALRCRAIQINLLALDTFTPTAFDASIQLEQGITLMAGHLSPDNRSVWLWWKFDQASTIQEIRFVHVVDAQGNLVAQNDISSGEHPADSEWIETVSLPDDLPAGTYTVYTGWYTLPDAVRLTVLSDRPGTENELLTIGSFTRE